MPRALGVVYGSGRCGKHYGGRCRFADRLLDKKYGSGNHTKGPGTEHSRINKCMIGIEMNEAVVFIVHHSRELEDDAWETKLIGVYTTEEGALRAIDQLREKPGFRDHPADFTVDRYKLDVTHWQDGFTLSSDDSL